MKTLDLYITKICNLNCEYCYVDLQTSESSFNYVKFSKRINLLEYEHIKFFWWEPLLKWQDIKNIITSIKDKDEKIKFTIVTNWLLIDEEKIDFAKKYNIEFVISVHKTWILKLKDKFKKLYEINNLVWFSFIFEEWNFSFPYKIFEILVKYWFKNFIFVPEIYSNWDEKNIFSLNNELNKILNLYSKNNINIQWISWDFLKEIVIWCEKKISSKDWEIFPCNRFDKIDELKNIWYKWIYEKFDGIIDLKNDKNKWFYVCPIWWFLDSKKTKIALKERIIQYKKLNETFLNFYKSINKINWKLNFLSDWIEEIRFNLTKQCNLRCEYCYVDFENKVIDEKIAKNIIDFFLLQDWPEKTISFFWWEPLLELSLLKGLVNYSKILANKLWKKVKFTIATNFLLVNEKIINFLKENNFEVHISFNWKNEINDKMRDNSTTLLIKNLDKFKNIIWVEKITILLAFSNNEISSLCENIKFINSQWFQKINLELIFWKNYTFLPEDFLLLKEELINIKKLNLWIELANLKQKNKFLDISVDWKSWENSFDFNKYEFNITNKGIFDKLILDIFSK